MRKQQLLLMSCFMEGYSIYYGDPLLTWVNALSPPYIVAKNPPEISHNFRTISARTSYIFFFFIVEP